MNWTLVSGAALRLCFSFFFSEWTWFSLGVWHCPVGYGAVDGLIWPGGLFVATDTSPLPSPVLSLKGMFGIKEYKKQEKKKT